jgi:hypothetical protein
MKWKEKEERGSTSGSVHKLGAVDGKSMHCSHLSSTKKAGGDGATASASWHHRQLLAAALRSRFFFCFCFVRFSLWLLVRFFTDGTASRRV